jgi:HTH-type transcriptional regulator/antitoxin HigA
VAAKKTLPDSYFGLVRNFPLRRLRNSAEHARAKSIFLKLSSRRIDQGARDYLYVLVDLIAEYEKRSHQAVDPGNVTAAELVRHRLEEKGISVNALAKEIGIAQSNLSEMLNGNRDWSKTAIRALSKLLNIRAERFLV